MSEMTTVDRIEITTGVKIIADIERFQMLITVELLVICVGDCIELGFVLRREHGHGIATEIATGHCNHVNLVAPDEFREETAETVFGIGRYVMEFIYGDQAIVERRDAKLFNREAECSVRANQNLVIAGKELTDSAHLGRVNALFVWPRCVAEIPLRLHAPI